MRTRLAAAAALVVVTLGSLASAAGAQSAQGEDKNCWGVVSAQRARAVGGLGEHASPQEEPRVGLGNLPALFGLDHISEVGTFLAQIDEIPETECG